MSDHYIALTRKYRPKSFEDIVSQGHVSQTIQNAIRDGRLSHAYLFCGPRGVGKTTMARVLARTINGVHEDVDSETITNNLDIIEIDAASNNSVDDIRLLRETVIIPPSRSAYKVYIIDEVHMLSKQAFNALLKTLEEPPSYVVFIFATTEPHKILPTILSRCQRFDFKRISVEEIRTRLRTICDLESIAIDEGSLHQIARKSDGSLRDALGLLDQAIALCGTDIQAMELMASLNMIGSDRLFDTLRFIYEKDHGSMLQMIHTLMSEGYDIQEFLSELLLHLRNLFVAKQVGKLELIEATSELREAYQRQSEQFSSDDLMRMMHIIVQSQQHIKESQQPRVHFEVTMIKLVSVEKSESLKTLMSLLQDLKNTPSTTLQKSAIEPKTALDTPKSDYQQGVSATTKTNSSPIRVVDPSPSFSQGTNTSSDSEDMFGSPAILKVENGSENNGLTTMAPSTTGMMEGSLALAVTQVPINVKNTSLVLNDLQRSWEPFLEYSRSQIPEIVFFSLNRTSFVDLRFGLVTMECLDPFSYKLLQEHHKTVSALLSSFHEIELTVKFVLKMDDHPVDSEDPYTRFKEMVKNDPKLRLIVDLFGAELEY
jgi:DNA polymerase-3 subunit gamma/tau